ncbi:helix-turn-helix domain-containing protein [Flammeovirga yaeyamensis]|uniref:Helix-turn-helix domain-containing protein n=1 Tax=Flammeovirga yaeyamensis TaxID=367791 RepID=A0AAX1NEY2_9BACT|nr:two-component regulator propeller domain-containing protein [Flammeovirga yaeyamensis]MBB3696994.1 ligand-binding sensor domain-containing protein/AraC-like DNA-binding protein [Flammeovirga yaeyamensis]NMF33657.1 helix-turn-helix domain-containing protein [Flammeovirga yaeyamensis]QWG05077.1 helix-turn-helix domain-containing protein [Flammeovirga yaeyamensis]
MRHIFTILLFILFNASFASNTFKIHAISQQLSNSEVYSLLEDHNGYIWIGTLDGLNYYDGYNIKVFNIGDDRDNTLSNNTIYALAEDKKNRIWIGTNDGLNIYEPLYDRFTQISLNKYVSRKERVNTFQIQGNHLFVGTHSGLYIININQETDQIKKSNFIKVNEVFPQSSINNIKPDPVEKGVLWIASSHGLAKIKYNAKKNRIRILSKPQQLREVKITAIDFDNNNNIWYSTAQDLNKYYIKEKKIKKWKDIRSISDLQVDRNGNLWISSVSNGLFYLNNFQLETEEIYFHKLMQTSTPLIRTLFLGKDGTMWIGTIGEGVNYLDVDNNPFKQYNISKYIDNKKITHFVRSIYKDESQNCIYFGLHNGGLYVYDEKSKVTKKVGLGELLVFDIKKIDQKIFVGTKQGIYTISDKGNAHQVNKIISIPSTCTNLLEGNTKGVLWAATLEGVYRFEKDGVKGYSSKIYNRESVPNLSGKNARVLFYDKEYHEIWVGFEGGGLNILSLDENENVKNVNIINSNIGEKVISNDFVRSIRKTIDGQYLIGTYNGLNILKRIDGENFKNKVITKNDGLLSNMIQSIEEDNDGNIWLGTNNGMSRLSIQNQEIHIINYNRQNGLPSAEFSEHASCKTDSGDIFFGTNHLFFSFNNKDIVVSDKGLKASIDKFNILGDRVLPNKMFHGQIKTEQLIPDLKEITLSPNETSFSLDFMVNEVGRAKRVEYAYFLEGFDTEWKYLSNNNRHIEYVHLPYGTYTLKYKASSVDGIFDEDYHTLTIEIERPYYLTWYAFLSYFIILVGIIYILYLSKFKREAEENFNIQANNQLDSKLKKVIEKESLNNNQIKESTTENKEGLIIKEEKNSEEEKEPVDEDKPRLSIQDEKFLNKLSDAIAEGLSDSEFTIETLEKELGMSHSNFYRKVKKVTGRSAKDILQEARLKKAAFLITKEEYRVSDVAYIVGFNNPKYFSKCFKEFFGMTPSQYEQTEKEKKETTTNN